MAKMVLQIMRTESSFRIAPNWAEVKKIAMTSQLSGTTSSSKSSDGVFFSFVKWLIVINEIRQISRKKLDFAKLTEARSEIS